MLKGIDPLLGPDLLMILRSMGHGDEIVIVDGNYPALSHAHRLVRMDGHGAGPILDAILSLLPLDDFADAAFRPGIMGDPAHQEPIMREFQAIVSHHAPSVTIAPLMGEAFYVRAKAAFAMVASGERALYGNIILRKGVIRLETAS